MTDDDRLSLADASGRTVLTYRPDRWDGRPVALDLRFAVPVAEAAAVMAEQLTGWTVQAPPDAGQELVRHGARLTRHARQLLRGLDAVPPEPAPPPGLRFVACDRPAEDIGPASSAAFPPGHIDHHADSRYDELRGLLDGSLAGPLLPCSLLGVREGIGDVVAGCIVNRMSGQPWITNLFRDPERSAPGTGRLLLQAVLARAAEDGLPSIGLAVTAGNPAQKLYERTGFVISYETFTVTIDEDHGPGPVRVELRHLE